MQGDDQLDSLIDRAISTYCEASARAGLEERVLNRIRTTDTAHRRFTGARWALALSMLMLVFVVMALRLLHSFGPKTLPVATSQLTSQPRFREISPEAPKILVSTRSTHPRRRRESLPKQEQFPAPTPLSSEERLLLAFVKRDPVTTVRMFGELQKRASEPIEIEAVEIKPLVSDGTR